MDVNVEDKVVWEGTKNRSTKSLYAILEEGSAVPFLADVDWKAWVPPKAIFPPFHLGGFLGQSFDYRPTLEEELANRCPPCFLFFLFFFRFLIDEDSIDHILLHHR